MHEGSILVVDDEPGILRLTQRLLEREGFDVITTSTAGQALDILARRPVDLILVDIRLPGIDGFQLMTQAREKMPDLAVVIMTGYGTVETAVEALHSGADGLILKPFIGSDFILGVKSALQENQRKREISRLRTLQTLFSVTEALFTETDTERLQSLVLNSMCEHLNCQTVLLYQQKTSDGSLLLLNSIGDFSPGAISALEGEFIKPVDRRDHLRSVSRRDLNGEDYPDLAGMFEENHIEAVLSMPVIRKRECDGEVYNVFLAARNAGKGSFQPADHEMFAILANQATAALENADLYAELRNSINQLEKSHRALVQAEKMAAAGRLTASIAHEINNPLQSVQNCLYLARREDLRENERRKYQDLAQSELERLITTVQRMLDFYRPGARDKQIENLDRLIERVLLLVEPQLKNGGINIETHLGASPASIMVVGNQIQQVMLNLIINAMEALPTGGTIQIETTSRFGKVEISITDDGPGIPKSIQEHLFEPFESTKENGTGLGLALSYGIITAHGGSLELISNPGEGARFQILLPIGDK